ncbi:MAG: hypothetical protein IKQ91_01705 [Oscillospiraceae bacterium]|nr:hypothetical protein [Oscillospiraceae bacterium]MBR4199977.1 hypothetical protein [Oscillospiraceae bacterium]
MNLKGAWQSFLLRIRSEFAVSDYCIYTGDGVQMLHSTGRQLQNITLERYLSFERTVVESDLTECRLITRFLIGSTVYLLVLYSADPNGFSENETDYILQDISALQEQLRHESGKEDEV